MAFLPNRLVCRGPVGTPLTGASGGLSTRRRLPTCPTNPHPAHRCTMLRPAALQSSCRAALLASDFCRGRRTFAGPLRSFGEDPPGRPGVGDAVRRRSALHYFHFHRPERALHLQETDRKSTRLNSSHLGISYAVFCLKK